MHDHTRRDFMAAGLALAATGAAGFPLASPAFAQAQKLKSPLNAFIFCHSMGSAEDIAKFRSVVGVDANVTCWTSNTDTLTKIVAGAGGVHDIFNINMQFIPPLIERGALAPIDFSKLKNAAKLSPGFKSPAYSTKNGKNYSLPFMFGYDTLLYNRDVIKEEVDSYGLLFDEKYKGRISLRDDPQTSLFLTALHLGYKNPMTLNAKDLRDITNFLIKKKHIIRKLYGGYAEAVALMRSKEVDAVAPAWVTMNWTLLNEGMNVGYALVKEGFMVWTHDWIMPAQAVARGMEETVYAFMDWSIGAEQGANMGRKAGYISPSSAALDVLTPEETKNLRYPELDKIISRGVWMDTFPENLQEWNDAWTRFKAA